MDNIRVSALRSKLTEVLGRVQYAGDIYTVEKYGEKIAAIIPIEDLIIILDAKKAR